MSLDHFVSLAARAETTQKAAKHFTNLKPRNADRVDSYDSHGVPSHQNRNFSSRPANTFQRQYPNSLKCYNCDQPGHISRNCPRNRQPFSPPQNFERQIVSNFSATGANRVPLNHPFGNNQNQEVKHHNPSRNFLRQNCVIVQEDEVPHLNVCLGKVDLDPEVTDFFDKLGTECSKKEAVAYTIGKVMVTRLFVSDVETNAMMDGGAQTSLISATFLYQLVTEKNLNLWEAGFCHLCPKISDVNGKLLECLGTVSIPVHRKGLTEPKLCTFNITKAPIGFNLLLGTDVLDDLGFKMYDKPNNVVIPFEKVKPERKDFLTVIFRTTLEPMSSKTVELDVDQKFEGCKIVTSPISSQIQLESSVGVVENGKIVASIMNLSESKVTIE
ncbi:hypothetical protein niasHT_038715 [Heterodera trifolii]|uniref:CCHC-type domain-containing protein n=1 Tax=Heterodera trifolii TaxID=157864 RepID=A0ABD2I7I5_9BILA